MAKPACRFCVSGSSLALWLTTLTEWEKLVSAGLYWRVWVGVNWIVCSFPVFRPQLPDSLSSRISREYTWSLNKKASLNYCSWKSAASLILTAATSIHNFSIAIKVWQGKLFCFLDGRVLPAGNITQRGATAWIKSIELTSFLP